MTAQRRLYQRRGGRSPAAPAQLVRGPADGQVEVEIAVRDPVKGWPGLAESKAVRQWRARVCPAASRCSTGESVPDAMAPARLPASAAMLACVRLPPPTASITRRAMSGAGNSASRAASGTPNSGDAGSAHSRSANSSAGTPSGQARSIPGSPPDSRHASRASAGRGPARRLLPPGSADQEAGCRPGRRRADRTRSAAPSCAGHCRAAAEAPAGRTAAGPRRSAARRRKSHPARQARAVHRERRRRASPEARRPVHGRRPGQFAAGSAGSRPPSTGTAGVA